MSRLPLGRRKFAAVLGAACIVIMPVALAGPASADPPTPIIPTIPVPQPPVQQQVPEPQVQLPVPQLPLPPVQQQVPEPQVQMPLPPVQQQVPQAPPVQQLAPPPVQQQIPENPPPTVALPPVVQAPPVQPIQPPSQEVKLPPVQPDPIVVNPPVQAPPQQRIPDVPKTELAPRTPPPVVNIPDEPRPNVVPDQPNVSGPQVEPRVQIPSGPQQSPGNGPSSGNQPPTSANPEWQPGGDNNGRPPSHQPGDNNAPPWGNHDPGGQPGNDNGPNGPPPWNNQGPGQPDQPGTPSGGWHPGDNNGPPWSGPGGQNPGDWQSNHDNGRPPWDNHDSGQPNHDNGRPPSGCDTGCQQLPPPAGGHNYPDWGNQPPIYGTPSIPVGNHNPPPRCGEQDCQPGPVLPGNWHNQWMDDCGNSHSNGCQPPRNPDIFVHNDINNQVVFVNNVVNRTDINIFVTNIVTGGVQRFPVPYGAPYALPSNWCGGASGGFAWSANIGVPFAGASFAGGGYFNANAGCGIVPYVPPPAPLIIAAPGYPQYYANNYVQPQGCGCVYVNNTYVFGRQQQVQGRTVFVPSSWTPDIVTQPAKQGIPPFFYGTGKTPSPWPLVGIVLTALVAAAAVTTGAVRWQKRNEETQNELVSV